MNKLSDLPIEDMYKLLYNDYKKLQEENKRLRNEVSLMLDVHFDEVIAEEESAIADMMARYHKWSKTRLIAEVSRLTKCSNQCSKEIE